MTTTQSHPDHAEADGVTVVARRKVKPGCEAEYEDWLQRLTRDARTLPGYLGAEFHRPGPQSPGEYVSVFRFATVADLEAFEDSDLRARYLREVAPYVEADAVWRKMTGLEFWFSPPAGTVVAQPSPFRMALLLVAVVYVLVLTLTTLATWTIGDWPFALRLIVTTTLQVFLMTYLIMPRLTRALARWIYPAIKTVGAAD
ncbi:antibiotic biosynthesis monooxygenase [Bauldia sp.]|uniref:antibiotic biosynthesis monooxygenase n=1 Tax=Bauldia sp. TaxID=2575872 RepID=UPI003BACFEDD